MKLLPIAFLLSTATCCTVAITRHKQVQCEINEEDAKALLKCLNESAEVYNVVVDEEGYLVIHPRDRRELDPTVLDAALFECTRQASNNLSTAAQDSKFDDDYTGRSYRLEDVTFERLHSDGWKGMTTVEYEQGFSRTGKMQQTLFHWSAFSSYHSDFSSEDYKSTLVNDSYNCQNPP